MHLGKRDSGYRSTVEDWIQFLACWRESVLAPAGAEGLPPPSVLDAVTGNATYPEALAAAIAQREATWDLALPASYRHFLLARGDTALPDGRAVFLERGVGLLPIGEVDRVSVLVPDVLASAGQFALNTPDAEYFVYGVDQDDASGRTHNLRDAIVVGKHGASPYELILVYPQNRTSDDEMEAALLYHAGEFRAPSFAEVIRQLYAREYGRRSTVPPYSQESLQQTCAGLIAPAQPWWR